MTGSSEKSLFSREGDALRRMLRDERRRRRLTQAEVAEKCGWPQSVIAKIEQGERRLDVVEFVWLAEAMGAKPGRLFGTFVRKLREGLGNV
jgi:transcriptional regulator with XRE-family HTH domain